MKPSKQSIRKILMDSLFDPRDKATPFSIVVDMNDPKYLENRAIEMIREAQICQPAEEYNEKIVRAISLLALSRAMREPEKKKKSIMVEP